MDSKDMQRLQTTQPRGYPLNREMEFQKTTEVHSISSASEDGRNEVQRYTSKMLEMIVERGTWKQHTSALLQIKEAMESMGWK
ncbi:hypothetical protein TheetDRAFT_1305 [Thermoanaerobacter ethanolicus JW 200]|nr:hypothetical protein TheetDRAFT_1305 [Thermoanaerobacter ethanolicus JW 200]